MKHAYVFTRRQEPQVLRLSPGARRVVLSNCQRCHAGRFGMVRMGAAPEGVCWRCHENIHGPARSLSASPHARRPRLPSAGLEWMKKGLSDD